AQAPERRVALVIGNAAYPEQPLKNAAADARLMADALKRLGFEVVARENATRAAMGAAVGEFARKLSPGVVALIYYAGHGIQSRGRNYLIPVDATLGFESDLRFQAVDAGALIEELEQAQARVSLVVLDACRNNPFEKRMRGAARGLAAVDAARGGLIAYATAPGSVAADGEGENGPYTEELVKALAIPNLKAEEVFKRVTAAVEERTGGRQTPWISSSLRGDFIFNMTVNVAPGATVNVGSQGAPQGTPQPGAAGTAAGQADREALFWQSAQAGNRIEEYREYLKQFPRGVFAGLARARIAALEEAAKPPPAPPAPPPPAPVAAPVPARNIEGLYNATGTNPNGTTYRGTVTITRSGGQYAFFWQVGTTYRGTGTFEGDLLVIHWGANYPVIYTLAPDGRLVGTWNNGNATEVLVKVR
ncbi:MAG: LIC10280 family protein, partial [Rhodospirillales bacterium]